MNILAVESSGRQASIAVATGPDTYETTALPPTRETAAWLNEAVDATLRRSAIRADEIDVLGITSGPGSFTGLRIAVTFAKMFCYSTSADLIALDTLRVIAHQAAGALTERQPLHVVVDAMRRELFHASFLFDSDGCLQTETPTAIVKRNDLLSQLKSPCTICGPAALSLREDLPETVTLHHNTSAPPTAVAVAQLALERHQHGHRDDPWKLLPRYHRKSYADEKRN